MPYKGFGLSQHEKALPAFEEFLLKEKPKRIIEVGTGGGGLSLFLAEICKVIDCEFFTFDIDQKRSGAIGKKIRNMGFSAELTNIFDLKTIEKVSKLISKTGRSLVLCDGGKKIKEINMFSKFLKPGDIIMAHDYFHDKEAYRKQKDWGWCEITNKDVKAKNLDYFYKDHFEKVFWTCRIKRHTIS